MITAVIKDGIEVIILAMLEARLSLVHFSRAFLFKNKAAHHPHSTMDRSTDHRQTQVPQPEPESAVDFSNHGKKTHFRSRSLTVLD